MQLESKKGGKRVEKLVHLNRDEIKLMEMWNGEVYVKFPAIS